VLRLDGLANSLASTAAVPSCIPGVPCETLVPHPNQVYSATVAAELRRMSGADRLFLLLGAGAYHARGTDSKSFGTTGGTVLGFGVDLASPTRAGFSIEVRYHYLPNNFGTLTGMLTPSLMFRF
jgi:hypothetical protein